MQDNDWEMGSGKWLGGLALPLTTRHSPLTFPAELSILAC